MSDVGRVSIFYYVLYFIVYLIIHFGIGMMLKSAKKELEQKTWDNDLKNTVKHITIAFNWFPAIYVIIIIFILWV